MKAHNKFSIIGSFSILLVVAAPGLNVAPRAASQDPSGSDLQPLPPFRGGSPITAEPGNDESKSPSIPFIEPKPVWDKFLILIWQYKTDVRKDLHLYKQVGIHGFHIDRGDGKETIVDFAGKHHLPYYVDHAADKGYLHLTDRTGQKRITRKRTVVSRPYSLSDPRTITILKEHIRKNVSVTRHGPVVAYAFDDEVSLGVFNSPCEVDGSDASVAGYRNWLRKTYGNIGRTNRTWGTNLKNFSQAGPVSFEAVRRAHTRPPFSRWNLSRWMDWRSYMDTQLAECLAGLTRFTNKLDPNTPAGIVGGQQPAPYGGYDYSKICRSVQWIESYDIGGTCEILRSLWCRPQRRPCVQTWFSTGDARRDAWFLWYYLLHGNRGVIAWPDRGGSWFHHKDGQIAPFITQNAETIREVQSDLSKHILDSNTRFDADPIAVYYSHPSIQAGWVMDVVTHGGTWPNRSSSLDNTCQTAAKNRVAWFKLLEDCGFQYNVVTAGQVAGGELTRQGYRVLILNRAVAISYAEAAAIRRFVQRGGTVIADHLTGILDEHGAGRSGGGVMDNLFGIQRDESKGYLDGKGITEIDGELYTKPLLQRLKYDGALRHDGIVVYERGTRARDGKATAHAGTADVLIKKRTGRGRTVYLNLTPVAYYDLDMRIGQYGRRWRSLLTKLLAESGLHPRAKVLSDGKPIPLAELVYWRKGGRMIVGLVKNPARQGSISGLGAVHGVTVKPIDVEIIFRRPVKDIRDLRTGKNLPAGQTIRAEWKPWEALIYQVTAPQTAE